MKGVEAGGFYGRTAELAGLEALTGKPTASLVTITGRRRNGKSRLVEEYVVDFGSALAGAGGPRQ